MKPEGEHRKHRINLVALALMDRGPVVHNCLHLHEISSTSGPTKDKSPTQMKTLGLGNSSPTFSPHLYREQKPPEEMAKAHASLEALDTPRKNRKAEK